MGMLAIEQEYVEWTLQITLAMIAAFGLIAVALINKRKNRTTTRDIDGQRDRMDTHASHIDSLEERTQANEKHLSQILLTGGVLVFLAIVNVFKILLDMVRRTMNP